MKTVLIALFISTAVYAEVTPSQQIDRIFTNAEIVSWGKRKHREATLSCRVKKTRRCEIFDLLGFENRVKVYEGEEAEEISFLLSSFGVKPQGRRQRQSADFKCKIPKKMVETFCDIIKDDGLIMP
jgi:hypothetical protein